MEGVAAGEFSLPIDQNTQEFFKSPLFLPLIPEVILQNSCRLAFACAQRWNTIVWTLGFMTPSNSQQNKVTQSDKGGFFYRYVVLLRI
jgi:hypothetical protein